MNTKKLPLLLMVLRGLVKVVFQKVVANEVGYLYIDTGAMYRGCNMGGSR